MKKFSIVKNLGVTAIGGRESLVSQFDDLDLALEEALKEFKDQFKKYTIESRNKISSIELNLFLGDKFETFSMDTILINNNDIVKHPLIEYRESQNGTID